MVGRPEVEAGVISDHVAGAAEAATPTVIEPSGQPKSLTAFGVIGD
jgi:hypothetical protein